MRNRGRVAYQTGASAGAGGRAGGRTGYVTQDDAFFSQLTVRETLSLAAQLSLPGAGPERAAHAVEAVLQKMGLVKRARPLAAPKPTAPPPFPACASLRCCPTAPA